MMTNKINILRSFNRILINKILLKKPNKGGNPLKDKKPNTK